MKKIGRLFWIAIVILCIKPIETKAVVKKDVDIIKNKDRVVVTLSNRPESQTIMTEVSPYLRKNTDVIHLLVSGELGQDTGFSQDAQINRNNLKTIRFEKSNYVSRQMFLGGRMPWLVESYTDDGTIKAIESTALSTFNNYQDNKMTEFISPNLEKLGPFNLDGFKGRTIDLPNLRELPGVSSVIENSTTTSENFNNFHDMPNIEEINLPSATQLIGFQMFRKMPNLKSIDLRKVQKITIGRGIFDSGNRYPVYVNLSSLTEIKDGLKGNNYIGSEKEATYPVYLKLGNKIEGDLKNSKTNAFYYTGINPVRNHEIEKGDTIKIAAFGVNDFYSFNETDTKIDWYVDGKLSSYTGATISVKTDGLEIGTHQFIPVINYKGQVDNSFFKDIPINLDVSGEKLTAESNPQQTILGSDVASFKLNEFVKNVRFKDTPVENDAYTAQLVNKVETNVIGEKNATIRVKLKNIDYKSIDVTVPLKVLWGNSIVLGSFDYDNKGRVASAFTLHTEKNPYITATAGIVADNRPIHSKFKEETYYSVHVFDMTSKQNKLMTEADKGDVFVEGKGLDGKTDTLKKWGVNKKQQVAYGDVVRAYQVETSKNFLYENEMKKRYNNRLKPVYYEVTSSGYRNLNFNHLSVKPASVPAYSTTQYLDENISSYLDLKGYKNITIKGFSEYPDTSRSGERKGKIKVEETLSTGKKIVYEYVVMFQILPGTLSLSATKNLNFDHFSPSGSEQISHRENEKSFGIVVSDTREVDKQGNWKLSARVANTNDGIAPYLIYRENGQTDKQLNTGFVPIYTHKKQGNGEKPLSMDITDNWKRDSGILLKIPSKNHLLAKGYSEIIIWNLVESP